MIGVSCLGSAQPHEGIARCLSIVIKKSSRYLAAVAASLLPLLGGTPPLAAANSPDDFIVPHGHFYTQANGFPPRTSLRGYAITNEDGILFWTKFNKLGGVETLGYPISQRLTYKGQVIQLTQRAVLVNDPGLEDVQLMDVFDLLGDAGRDDWLKANWGIPARVSPTGAHVALGTPAESTELARLLEQSPQIKQYYQSDSKIAAVLGLPTSNLNRSEQYDVMRFQKGALQLWNVETDWARPGDITMVNAGDILKQSGLLPTEFLAPQEPPDTVVSRAAASNRGQRAMKGLATWYGADFQGMEMRNGEVFDMYNPTTAASNIFPLNTRLLVSSLDTGESVEVRITDTGAFRSPIIVDLSWAAFKKLGNPAAGVLQVVVEPVDSE